VYVFFSVDHFETNVVNKVFALYLNGVFLSLRLDWTYLYHLHLPRGIFHHCFAAAADLSLLSKPNKESQVSALFSII